MTPYQALLIQLGSIAVNSVGCADLGGGHYRLDFADGTSREATPAEIASCSPSFIGQTEKAAASAVYDSGVTATATAAQRIHVATLQLILDEFNRHTTWESAVMSAIAAATSLANLQTRIAAITPVPARTQNDMVTAIKNKISATAE